MYRSVFSSLFSIEYNTSTAQQLTIEELRKHCVPGNYYVAIRGKVYDVSEFLDRHPGGRDVLKLAAGRDCTQLFESYHSFEIERMLPKFEVGELVTSHS